jgi:uncharacterized protein with HEPN domain
MPSKSPRQALEDILENIGAAREFTAGLSFEAFEKDRIRVYAVVRALEIVSEASRRIPDEIKSRMPDIDWRNLAAAGNVYRHAYNSVEASLIWNVLQKDLGPLEASVEVELRQWPG